MTYLCHELFRVAKESWLRTAAAGFVFATTIPIRAKIDDEATADRGRTALI
jgi:hypothetical protein